MITVVENNSLHADVEIACIEEYHRILAGTLNAHKAHHLLSINERTELTTIPGLRANSFTAQTPSWESQ